MSGHNFSHCPPECDRVMQAPRLWPKCPTHLLTGDPSSAHLEEIDAKSLWLKILKLSRWTSRFCGRTLVFSRIYGEQGGGGGDLLESSHWPAVGSRGSLAHGRQCVTTLRILALGTRQMPSPRPRSAGKLSRRSQLWPNIVANSKKRIAKTGVSHAC